MEAEILDRIMESVSLGFELLGTTIIVVGGIYGLIKVWLDRKPNYNYFEEARRAFGRPLMLGLEVLVAADIIETIIVDPTLKGAAALGIFVVIRVLLSFSLDIEVDGVAPWRRREVEGKDA